MGLKSTGRNPKSYKQQRTLIRLGWRDTWREKWSTCQQSSPGVLQISRINDIQRRRSQQRRVAKHGQCQLKMKSVWQQQRWEWCDGQHGGEPVRRPEQLGDLWRSKGGTDSDGYEKEKAGMVRARQKRRWNWKHPSRCCNEDRGEAP